MVKTREMVAYANVSGEVDLMERLRKEREVEAVYAVPGGGEGVRVRIKVDGTGSMERVRETAVERRTLSDDAVRELMRGLPTLLGTKGGLPSIGASAGFEVVNWEHELEVDLTECVTFTLSGRASEGGGAGGSCSSFFDYIQCVYEGGAGRADYVDFSKTRGRGLRGYGDCTDGRRLGQFVTYTGEVVGERLWAAFSSYASSRLHQFGVAVFCVYVRSADVVYGYPLYNNVEEVGRETTTQYGVTMIPVGTRHVVRGHAPCPGRTTVRGSRAPALKPLPSGSRVGETFEEFQRTALTMKLRETVRPSVLRLLPHVSEESLSSKEAWGVAEEGVGVRCLVTGDVTVPCGVSRGAATKQWLRVGRRVERYTEGEAGVSGEVHAVAVLQGLSGTDVRGDAPWMRSGECSEWGVRMLRCMRVCWWVKGSWCSDSLRNHLVAYGLRMVHGLVVVYPEAVGGAGGVESVETVVSRTAFNMMPVVGYGTMVVVCVCGRYHYVYGWRVGEAEGDVPRKGEDVTAAVEAYLSEAYEGPTTWLERVEGGEGRWLEMDGDSAGVAVDRAVARVFADETDEVETHRVAALVELLPPLTLRRVKDACEEEGAGLRAARAALRASYAEDPSTFGARSGKEVEAYRRARKAQKRRDVWRNKHFWGRMTVGASEGRVRRGVAIRKVTALKDALLADRERFVEHCMGDEERLWVMVHVGRGAWKAAESAAAGSAEGTREAGSVSWPNPFHADPRTGRVYDVLDGVTGGCVLEVGGEHESVFGACANTTSTRWHGGTLGVPTDKLVLPLLSCFDELELDFCAAAEATENEGAALWRQVLRQALGGGTRWSEDMGEAGRSGSLRDSFDPWSRATTWLMVHVLLSVAERLPRPTGVVAREDQLATMHRRLVGFVALTLGSGQTPFSGIADFFSARRPKLHPMSETDWEMLVRVVRASEGTGWGRETVRERLRAFVVRYVHGRVVQPVFNGLREMECSEKEEWKETCRAEERRRGSAEYQRELAYGLWCRWSGVDVPSSVVRALDGGTPAQGPEPCTDSSNPLRVFRTTHKKERLLHQLLTNASVETLRAKAAGIERCVGTPLKACTVRDIVEWYLTRRLVKVLRDALGRSGRRVQWWQGRGTGRLVRSVLGNRGCEAWARDVTKTPLTDEDRVWAGRAVTRARMVGKGARELVQGLRAEAARGTTAEGLVLWFGDWPSGAPTRKTPCSSTAEAHGPHHTPHTPHTPTPLHAKTLLHRVIHGDAGRMNREVARDVRETLEGVGCEVVVQSRLKMPLSTWKTLCEMLGWTNTRVRQAMAKALDAGEVDGERCLAMELSA